ncbi:MAG TPA: Loki-CTERM sorting domain-containing protein [Candidatus Lokiarchaeia archaeon]|nr:Loki-CTERM sorting domain-containing protein [Candidatus Lokiarchaeia archaeon]
MKLATKLGTTMLVLLGLAAIMGYASAAASDYVGVGNGDSFNWTYTISGSNADTNSCTIGANVINNPIEIATNVSVIYVTYTSTNDSVLNSTIYSALLSNITITSMANPTNITFFIDTNAPNMTYNSGLILLSKSSSWQNATYGANGVLQQASQLSLTSTMWTLKTWALIPQTIPGYPLASVLGFAGVATIFLFQKKGYTRKKI